MKLLSKDMLRSISFNSLNFIEPYSEVSDSNRYKGKPVLIKGLGKVPGVVVTKYIDHEGVLRYSFNPTESSLKNSVWRIYTLLKEKKVNNLQFATIPVSVSNQQRILKKLKKDYLGNPLDNHFELLKPWLTKQRTDRAPIEELSFRRPFTEFDRFNRFSFYDYKNRSGLYLFREKMVAENTLEDVYVGETTGVMSSRIRDKFYPNPHLYYREIPGVREYYIASIEIQRSMLPRGVKFDKELEKYQNILINLLNTRDNKLGKQVKDLPINGFKPFHTGKDDPFPVYVTAP